MDGPSEGKSGQAKGDIENGEDQGDFGHWEN
jgi:hypothetical protein